MKRLGMIGGSGWPSTLEYYRLLNTYYCEAKGPSRALDLVLRNLDFEIFRNLLSEGKRNQALQMLVQGAADCKKAGAEFLIFTANGLHSFLDEIERDLDLPVLHIADATAKAVYERAIKKVGLLGVKLTMEGNFYQNRLGAYGIETLVPNETDRETIHQIIFSELVAGKFTQQSRDIYLGIMEKLVAAGAEGIILGCTEIPLLVKQTDAAYPLFATTEIHCRAAVDFAVGD